MERNWLKTENSSILDLNLFGCFWVEFTPHNQRYTIFCSPEESEYDSSFCHIMGSFDSALAAEEYLRKIHRRLLPQDGNPSLDGNTLSSFRQKLGIET